MTCCTLYKTTGRTIVTIPDPPGSTPVRPIPNPEIADGRIPTPTDHRENPFGGESPSWGSSPVSTPSPGSSGPGGGDTECRTCRVVSGGGNTGIAIPPGCCRIIIVFAEETDESLNI